MAREAPRIGLADMADPERKEEPVERNRPARVDGVEQVARRSLAEPFPLAQRRSALPIARLKRENISRRADQTFGEKEFDQLFAQSLDVEGVAGCEMLEAFDRLRRTDERAGAAAHDVRYPRLLVDLAQSRRAADRAGLGEDIGFRFRRPLVEHDREHLRNHVAGALHQNRVADAHVLARNLVLVVQGGVGDDDAADGHGLELGDWRERAGAADVDLDRLDDRRRLLGRELVRDRPARRARDEAEPLLQRRDH